MESYLTHDLYDLISPDGKIIEYNRLSPQTAQATILIQHISPAFRGFSIDLSCVCFNLKSTLAQLGLDGLGKEYRIDSSKQTAEAMILLTAYTPWATMLLDHLCVGCYVGKLFAADERRKVRDPWYLERMFHRNDRNGSPLLYLGNPSRSEELRIEKKEGYAIAFLSLLPGCVEYTSDTTGMIPLLAKMLQNPTYKTRNLLPLLQNHIADKKRIAEPEKMLLVKTKPLHIRTVFGRIAQPLLPEGFCHTSANLLEPETQDSGDIYELFGKATQEIHTIPLEFFTLEPHREHIFFADRDQLQACLEEEKQVFTAFEKAPQPSHHEAAIFLVKGEQLQNHSSSDWITRDPQFYTFPSKVFSSEQQTILIEQYLESQAIYPFLHAIEQGEITSQGVLFSRFFPSPLLKKMLLSAPIQRSIRRIYFQHPSHAYGDFFSHEDRALLHDLARFGIPVYWVDKDASQILQYIPKPNKDTGMFVPTAQVHDFLHAASFGIYGSNLLSSHKEKELYLLFQGLEKLRHEMHHPLFHAGTPIAIITGGGPGVMEMGNKLAKTLGLLSCANIVDFRHPNKDFCHEQTQNPYVDIKMTYRLDQLVERQAEFHLDFPIFVEGGIGTDFEFNLEELRRKVGATSSTPVLLFGSYTYWKKKITSRFLCNLEAGTIQGSEWVSNCFFAVETAEEALRVYQKFFTNNLHIGKGAPMQKDGFVSF